MFAGKKAAVETTILMGMSVFISDLSSFVTGNTQLRRRFRKSSDCRFCRENGIPDNVSPFAMVAAQSAEQAIPERNLTCITLIRLIKPREELWLPDA